MVLFCVERRKAWRRIQSRIGMVNEDYVAQSKLLKAFDAGELDEAKFFCDTTGLLAKLAEA